METEKRYFNPTSALVGLRWAMGGDGALYQSLRSVLFERPLGGVVVSLGKEGSGDCEPVVDFPVFALGRGVDPEAVVLAAGVIEGDGHPLMGTEDVADGAPAAMIALLAQAELDGVEQVISQDADEDMSIDPPLKLVEHRPQPQIAFQGLDRLLHAGQRGVKFPDLLPTHVLAAGAQQVGSVQP